LAAAGWCRAAGGGRGIHLDLYLTGYRTIPTIGWLFLLQVITAFALALAVLVTASRLAAVAVPGFALATLGGYLLSIWAGLFGFQGSPAPPRGIVAGVVGGRRVRRAGRRGPRPAGTPARRAGGPGCRQASRTRRRRCRGVRGRAGAAGVAVAGAGGTAAPAARPGR
jgi:hypothetical protein